MFNTGIKINLLQDFLLISLDTFKKYRYSDIITGRTNVTEYDCDKTQYSDGISDKMVSDRIKYMSLFVAKTPEEIDRLVALFPDLDRYVMILMNIWLDQRRSLICFQKH